MALDRPMDAIASYESALQFDMKPETRNKIFANMGQAYVADGKMEKAVRAFESALADKTYVFNDAANVDYQRAGCRRCCRQHGGSRSRYARRSIFCQHP